MSKAALPQMPQYSQDFILDFPFESDPSDPTSPMVLYGLYIRYYGPWNPDGSREPVSADQVYWPEVIVTNSTGESISVLATKVSTDESLTAFPSYATIKQYSFTAPPCELRSTLTVRGFFEQTGYMSLSLYKGLWASKLPGNSSDNLSEQHYRGDELTVVNDGLNPFVKGNPSVFSYERPAPTLYSENALISRESLKPYACFVNESKKNIKQNAEPIIGDSIDFYRPSAQSFINAEYGNQESRAPDGCSADYMASLKLLDSNSANFVLKLKVPTTFIHNDTPDITYAGYQVQELTIDTYTEKNTVPLRYGLNSRLLNDYKDTDGYVYVFLMPPDDVTKLAQEQGLDYSITKIPPVFTFEGNTGYVLDRGAVNIRHRGSDPAWEGYIGNSLCYLKDADLEPIKPEDLGEYYPELIEVYGFGSN